MSVCREARKNNTICHKTFKTDKNTLKNEFLNEKTFQPILIRCIGSMTLSKCKITESYDSGSSA